MNPTPDAIDPARYHLGHPLIDAEHAELIHLVNRLHLPDAPVTEILSQLQEYVRSHFTVEEEFMRCSRYPGEAAHRAQHDDFRRHLMRISEFARQDQAPLTRTMRDYLVHWLSDHIAGTDRKLVEFLAARQWS